MMAKHTKKGWSYSAGEKGRNRVRAFTHSTGVLMLEFTGRIGRRERKSLGHRDRDKAKQQAEEAAVALGKAEKLKPKELTLGELFEMYLGQVTPHKAQKTQGHDRQASRLFLRALGPRTKPETLHRGHWDAFIRDRESGRITQGGPVGARTVARDLKWLGAVLNWAALSGDSKGGFLLDRNPFRGLKAPREKNPTRPMITHERYEAMLEVAAEVDWRFRVALILAHETGRRVGSVRQLRWSDVDLERQSATWRSEHDKMGFERETPISDAALEAILEARNHAPGLGDAWLLPGPRTPTQAARADQMTRWWKQAERRAGLEPIRWLGWHSLRRRFATDTKDLPARDVCDLAGWKDPGTPLRIYQQSTDDDLRATLSMRRRAG